MAKHDKTITWDELKQEVLQRWHISDEDCDMVLKTLENVLMSHLLEGDLLELPYIGIARLDLIADTIESKETFDESNHIHGVKVFVQPYKGNDSSNLYDNLSLTMLNN